MRSSSAGEIDEDDDVLTRVRPTLVRVPRPRPRPRGLTPRRASSAAVTPRELDRGRSLTRLVRLFAPAAVIIVAIALLLAAPAARPHKPAAGRPIGARSTHSTPLLAVPQPNDDANGGPPSSDSSATSPSISNVPAGGAGDRTGSVEGGTGPPPAEPTPRPQVFRRVIFVHHHLWSLLFVWDLLPAALSVIVLAAGLWWVVRKWRSRGRAGLAALEAAAALAVGALFASQSITVPDSSRQPVIPGPVVVTTKHMKNGDVRITERHNFYHRHLPIEVSVYLLLLALTAGALALGRGRIAISSRPRLARRSATPTPA
jgi:hypothetical protein